ncbi:MAG: D-aminoacylase, partial [bacterium]
VRAGAFADLVVLDPQTIGSEATFDAPRRATSGIAWVMVNGTVVISPGSRRESSLPSGRVLRRQG